MEEQKISFKTAKLAKEKGFDWDCYFEYEANDSTYREGKPAYSTIKIKRGDLTKADEGLVFTNWCDNFSAPTQSLLQKWLREKYNLYVIVDTVHTLVGNEVIRVEWKYSITSNKDVDIKCVWNGRETYEEALEIGLQETLKLIKIS